MSGAGADKVERSLVWLPVCALLVTLIDQASKYWIIQWLPSREPVVIIPRYFYLVLVHNPGAAFGLLSRGDVPFRRFFFVVVSLIALGLLAWLFRSAGRRDRLIQVSLGLITGGAIGNLIDRVRWGYVVDFLDVHLGKFHWPTFNIADSAISVGVIILILDTIFFTAGAAQEQAPESPAENSSH